MFIKKKHFILTLFITIVLLTKATTACVLASDNINILENGNKISSKLILLESEGKLRKCYGETCGSDSGTNYKIYRLKNEITINDDNYTDDLYYNASENPKYQLALKNISKTAQYVYDYKSPSARNLSCGDTRDITVDIAKGTIKISFIDRVNDIFTDEVKAVILVTVIILTPILLIYSVVKNMRKHK